MYPNKDMGKAGQEDLAVQILNKVQKLKSDRGPLETQLQEIKELVRPSASDFNRTISPGESKTLKIFDTTAGKNNRDLASGLSGYLVSPVDRWFNCSVGNKNILKQKPAWANWLEFVSDKIYKTYSKPSCNFNTTLNEGFLDLGALGTTVILQERDLANKSIVFNSFPLASCLIEENNIRQIDTLYRMVEWTTRQVIQEFGDATPKKISDEMEKNPDKVWNFIHAVYPRKGRDIRKKDAKNKAFASCWVSKECKAVVREGGYNSFPYHCPRWTKCAGEVYGSSPAMDCMPDIRMVNEMKKTILKGAQKKVDPPLMVDSEGFLAPIKTAPGSLIWRDSTEAKIEPLMTGGDIELGIEMLQQPRQHISECFFVDWLRQQKNDTVMTATEVLDRRDEQLRLMASILGRLQAELLGPMIQRTYELLVEMNEIPPCPDGMELMKIQIDYISPAARAQSGTKVTAMMSVIKQFAEVATVAPQIFEKINFDRFGDEIIELSGITRRILNTDEEIAAARQQKAQQQMLAQGAESGGKIAGAVKDLAQAQSFARK